MNKSASIVGGIAVVSAVAMAFMLFSDDAAEMPLDSSDVTRQSEESVPTSGIFEEDLDPVEQAILQVSGENPMEGILALRTLANAEPPNVDAILWLGKFSIQSGQMDKARERFDSVLELQPDHLEATWELAMLDMEEGQLDRAVAGFETCYGADEAYANGMFFAGRCYRMMGNTRGAAESCKQYLAFAPDSIVYSKVYEYITELEAELNG